MVDQYRHLAGLLNQLGAPELAYYVWNDEAPSGSDIERLRTELIAAAAAAGRSGQQASLAAAIRESLVAGGTTATTLRSLMPSATRAAVPTPQLLEPAPPTPTVPPTPPAAPTPAGPTVSPAPPMDPFAVTVTSPSGAPPPGRTASGVTTRGRPIGTVGDELAWAVVAVGALGVAAALWLPTTALWIVAALLLTAQVTLVVLDRRGLVRAGVRRPPGWGWVPVAPAYLYRRARCLDQRPLQAIAFVAVGMAGRVAAGVFGVGGGDLLDASALEELLAAEHEIAWEQPTTAVECPRRVEVRVDDEFECVVRFEDGGRRTVTFRIESEAGHLSQIGTSYTNVPDA